VVIEKQSLGLSIGSVGAPGRTVAENPGGPPLEGGTTFSVAAGPVNHEAPSVLTLAETQSIARSTW